MNEEHINELLIKEKAFHLLCDMLISNRMVVDYVRVPITSSILRPTCEAELKEVVKHNNKDIAVNCYSLNLAVESSLQDTFLNMARVGYVANTIEQIRGNYVPFRLFSK